MVKEHLWTPEAELGRGQGRVLQPQAQLVLISAPPGSSDEVLGTSLSFPEPQWPYL